jgi:SAM-dependent methyltransferase
MPEPDLKSFDRVAHVYDETRGLPPDVERAIGGGIARLLFEAAPRPRLLEVGVGTGRIASPIADEGVRVAGIDISQKMLGRLREKRGDIDVMLAEASLPPLRERVFDALLFVHILHLVPDAEVTLRATLPLLRPGGLVLFGGDEGQVGKRAEAEGLIRQATADIAGVALSDWVESREHAKTTGRVLREFGATARPITLAKWRRRATGRAMITRLERQDYSSSWQIPKDALPAIIERVTPQLDALYGGLDREVEFERSFVLTVAALPA